MHAILINVRKTRDQYLLTLLLFNFSFEVFCDFIFYERNAGLLEIHNEAVFVLKNGKEKFKNSIFVTGVSVFKDQNRGSDG